jgi:hypothetical protein
MYRPTEGAGKALRGDCGGGGGGICGTAVGLPTPLHMPLPSLKSRARRNTAPYRTPRTAAQVVHCVLANAFKYTRKGSVTIESEATGGGK